MDNIPTTPFWLNEPTILFNKKQISEIWPNQNMTNMEKLNAISRFVIIASLLGYLVTLNFRIIKSDYYNAINCRETSDRGLEIWSRMYQKR
jgi:hypothetical protein